MHTSVPADPTSTKYRLSLTWDDLVALEPHLQELLDEARAVPKHHPCYCAGRAFSYGQPPPNLPMRQRMEQLVGVYARQQETILRTEEAWHVALAVLLEALGSCGTSCSCC